MKKFILRIISFLLPHKSILIFCTGFFLSSAIIFKLDADYTEDLFKQLARHIKEEAVSRHYTETETIIHTMNVTYKMQLENKRNLFSYRPQSFKGIHMRSSDLDLLDVSGSCGSATVVLMRTYLTMGYQARIGQMYVNNHYAGHMIVEVKVNGKWRVLDPLFNQFFYKSDSSLASFEDLKQNFKFYSKQCGKWYPKKYMFENVRYTNWNKIPLISPLLKKGLNLIYGEKEANEICLRKYIIKFYIIWHYLFLTGFIVCSFFLLLQKWLERNKI